MLEYFFSGRPGVFMDETSLVDVQADKTVMVNRQVISKKAKRFKMLLLLRVFWG